MTSFDKVVVGFSIVWLLMPVTAILVRSYQGKLQKKVAKTFWIPWGNVLAVSLMTLETRHPAFYHRHSAFVLIAMFLWFAFLLWNLWGVASETKNAKEDISEADKVLMI